MFFQFVRLDEDWFAKAVVRLSQVNPPWILALDRTNWKFGKSNINILMLCIVTKRYRLPLMWTMLDKQGCSNSADRIALMQRYLDIFGPGSVSYPLADREFIGSKWIEFLLKNKVMFSIRIKSNMNVLLDDGRKYMLKTLLQKRRMHAFLKKRWGRLDTLSESLGMPLRFACKRRADGELIIIITNSKNPAKALAVYKKRWFIECLFKDSKSGGLNMEDTHMTILEKISLLTQIITLAMVWSYACAKAIMGRRDIEKGRDGYPRKSWFRTGFDGLRNWIFNQPDKAADIWRKIWPKRKNGVKFGRVV